MTQVQANKPGMTPQMRQMIGIGGLIVCLLAGGGIVWWFLFGAAPARREVAIDPNQPVRMQGRQMPTPRVQRLGEGDWAVRGDTGTMRVSGSSSDYKLSFGFLSGRLGINQQQINLLSGRFRIIQDAAMAKAWEITPEQLDKLKKLDLGGGGSLKPTSSERAEMKKLFQDYQAASDKGPAQKALVDKLDAVAKANLEPAKKLLLDRIEQIRQILTAEQVAKITK